MAGRVYVRDLEILQNLQGELSQFNYGTNRVLGEVTRGISETQELLNSRASHWKVELRKREDALRGCLSNNDKDRNCNKETTAVREAQEALEKLQKLNSRLEQAIGEYQPHANRLQQLVNSKTSKAKGSLQRSIEKYQNYLAHEKPSHSSSGSSFRQPQSEESNISPDSKTGIKWSEWKVLWEKWGGEGLTMEEYERMNLPISDLQEGTLAEDKSWMQQLEEKGYLNAIKESQVATDLMDAISTTLKIINSQRPRS